MVTTAAALVSHAHDSSRIVCMTAQNYTESSATATVGRIVSNISSASVASRLTCGGIFYKFTDEPRGKRTAKIDENSMKLRRIQV